MRVGGPSARQSLQDRSQDLHRPQACLDVLGLGRDGYLLVATEASTICWRSSASCGSSLSVATVERLTSRSASVSPSTNSNQEPRRSPRGGQDRADIGMVQRRQHPRLALEARGRQWLVTRQAILIATSPNFGLRSWCPHAAAPGGVRVTRRGSRPGRSVSHQARGSDDGGFRRSCRSNRLVDQDLDFAPQRVVIRTSPGEKHSALVQRPRDCSVIASVRFQRSSVMGAMAVRILGLFVQFSRPVHFSKRENMLKHRAHVLRPPSRGRTALP